MRQVTFYNQITKPKTMKKNAQSSQKKGLLSKSIIALFFGLFKSKKEPKEAIIQIKQETILQVLEALAKFEKKDDFLKHVSLHSLAKKCKTNPKYLSKIINTHFQKNFRTYINDLRIQYVLKKLKNDTQFRTYSVKVLAQECGFSTTESFSKAFLKNTGWYPSQYISNTFRNF